MTHAPRQMLVAVLLALAGCGRPAAPPAVTPPTVPAPKPKAFPPPADPEVQAWVTALTGWPVRHWEERPRPHANAADARRKLVAAGARAAPHLLALVVDLSAPSGECMAVLIDIGPPALGAVRDAWAWTNEFDNNLVRWQLMPFLERYDPGAALAYALDQLKHGDWRRAAAYLAEHNPSAGRAELLRLLDTAPVGVRWWCVGALATFGDPEVVAALVKLLDKDSWARRDPGPNPYSDFLPMWWPDGRNNIVQALVKMKAAAAVPALVKVLEDRGPGRAYMGDLIIPFLAEYGGPECVPALTAIASAGPADMGRAAYPRALAEMKAEAADAIRAITARQAAPAPPPAAGR